MVLGKAIFGDSERVIFQLDPVDLQMERPGSLVTQQHTQPVDSRSIQGTIIDLTAESRRLKIFQREYTLAKLEGYTDREIAEKCGVALRSVERKLYLIRRVWWDHRERDAG